MMRLNVMRPGIRDIARRLCRRGATLDISAPGWDALVHELNAWQRWGRMPVFWWRDDDAVAATPALGRLLAVARSYNLPLALAVIPAAVEDSLPTLLEAERRVFVLQHGWEHANFAPPGQEAELWDDRDPAVVSAQLAAGRRRLQAMFGERFLPALVPPNNYLGLPLVPVVRRAYRYVSIYGDWQPHRLTLRNVHCDLIDWRVTQAVSSVNAVRSLVLALRMRRYGLVEAGLPIGILSHHLVHDRDMWRLLESLLDRLVRHPIAVFRDIPAVFPMARAAAPDWSESPESGVPPPELWRQG